ncbi:hypothetical protein J3F84DRAFT_405588 [Trichoderma pleuroticola]
MPLYILTNNTQLIAFRQQPQSLNPNALPPPTSLNALQDAILRLPGRVVTFLRGHLYINAFLIQSRGTAVQPPYNACRNKIILDADGYANPFPTYRNYAACYTRRDAMDEGIQQGRSLSNSPPQQGTQQGSQRQLTAGSAGNLIDLDDNNKEEDNKDKIEVKGNVKYKYNSVEEDDKEEEGITGNPI